MSKAIILGATALLITSFLLVSMMPSNNHSDKELEISFQEDTLHDWKLWKAKYNRVYESFQEEVYRIKVFKENQIWIEKNQGDTYTLEINEFGDLTREEFRARYLGGYKPMNQELRAQTERTIEKPLTLNQTVNWVNLNDVSPIYNQGQCGSCWAFSATESIESAYSVYLNQHPTPSLSMEQLVQCSSSFGNMGCNGGLMTQAFQYVMQNPLNTYANYPYTSGNGVTGTCNTALQNAGTYGISGYTPIQAQNCTSLMYAMNLQPISVAVDAANWSYYQSGIFSLCGQTLDHGVLAVGYQENSYWLIKNSWGTSWGQQGFIQLKWGDTCGLCNDASYPQVNGPSPSPTPTPTPTPSPTPNPIPTLIPDPSSN